MRATGIDKLDVADGIKEMLLLHGYTLWSVRNTKPSELASSLGIDHYLAVIIHKAAKKLTDPEINFLGSKRSSGRSKRRQVNTNSYAFDYALPAEAPI